jgi:hypothetical protein
MSLLSVGSPRRLALAGPCALAVAGLAPRPALALSAPDARAVCFAVGGLVVAQSENARACRITGVGSYEVVIGNDVTGCTFVATLGRYRSAVPPAGEIGVAQGGASNTVRVQTRDSAGAPANRVFHLVVAC